MHLGRGKELQYFMNGHQLARVTEERDLGVQLTSDMKPSRQCQLAYSTASKVLAMSVEHTGSIVEFLHQETPCLYVTGIMAD